MEKENEGRSFEEALMHELRFGGLDKDNLNELLGSVAQIQKGGIKAIRVFPKGIPRPEGLQVSGIMDAAQFANFSQILMKTPRVGRVEVFPHGIPWPDMVRVKIDLGVINELDQVRRI